MAQILIIDDDEQMLDMMARTLGKCGHGVITAANGKLGMALLEQQNFDLVVTDIVMPEMDGLEVITAMRNIERRPAIIAISGGSQRLDALDMLQIAKVMKVELVMQKPFTPQQLQEAVETMLLLRSGD